ncbi:response regulator [Haloplanus ruber]|uniref:Response regulator n=1 Tax=Haloplanus ruber TaxID=869892 RepID=A0ABD6CWQ5_9EURY
MSATTNPIRVLHVDDDSDFLSLASTFLERESERLDVETAMGAAQGLERLAATEIDCVVSDYDMPGRDGVEFLETVRERHGDLPFILFTGKGSEEVASEAISAGVTDYVRKRAGADGYTILANRIENAVEASRARARAIRQERINTLIREVNRRLVAAETTTAVERAVCGSLTDADPYCFAWIGKPDGSTVTARTSAGDAAAYLDEVTVRCDERPGGARPVGEALRTGELQVVQHLVSNPDIEPWHDAAERYGFESMAVVPLGYGDGDRGVLAIYADRPDAFGEVERTVLAELGETTSSALGAADTKRRLESREAADRRRKEHYYRTLAEALPNGAVALFDTDLRYTVVGGAVFEDLDISPAALEGEALAEAHSATFRQRFLDHYRAALDGEETSFGFEYGERRFEAHVAPVRDEEGTVVGGLAMTQRVLARSEQSAE